MTFTFVRSLALTAAFVVTAAAPAFAQTTRAPLTPEQPYYQTLALNPVWLPFGAFSADYERALSPAMTLGIGGSYVAFRNEDQVGWVDVKALYYPNEEALKGFGIGLVAGFISAHSRHDAAFFFGEPEYKRHDSAPTLGVAADYNWLIGRRNRFLVGLGGGAKRVLKNVPDGSALNQVYPYGRFSIGLAF